MSVDQAIATLAETLHADGRVSAAILFGSAARGCTRAGSDVDIAVRAAPGAVLDVCGDILGELMLACGRDVHLIDLENTGPTLRHQIFKYGRVLFDRDHAKTVQLLERTLVEFADAEVYRRIVWDALGEQQRENHA